MKNKLSLYQINEEMAKVEQAIYNTIDEETGEVNGDLVQLFKDLQVAKEDKLKGYIAVINKSDDTVELIDKEIKRLNELKKRHKNLTTRLRKGLIENLEVGKKIDLQDHLISWRKSTSTEIADEDKFCEKYKDTKYVDTKIIRKPIRDEIKKAIQDGEKFDGAELLEKQNLVIK